MTENIATIDASKVKVITPAGVELTVATVTPVAGVKGANKCFRNESKW